MGTRNGLCTVCVALGLRAGLRQQDRVLRDAQPVHRAYDIRTPLCADLGRCGPNLQGLVRGVARSVNGRCCGERRIV